MDTNPLSYAARLSDLELLAQVKELAQNERHATVVLIAHLAEIDARRLYLGEGCSSLFAYCTQVLHLSEHAAYRRIEAARCARMFPLILEQLEDGSVTLTTVGVLAPHLTPDNYRDLLDAARGASKRDVEELVARLQPQPSVPDAIRKLPASTSTAHETLALLTAALAPASGTGGGSTLERPTLVAAPTIPVPGPVRARPAVVAPLAPNRYKVTFTASAALHAKLRQAQALLRHQIPTGDLEQIFDRALTALLRDVARQKAAATERPRDAVRRHGGESGGHEEPSPDSRHVPATVRRAVWTRDGGQCAFVAQNGRRCAETGFVEFHHILPYAKGGQATEANIELRCRAHNGYEAERELGQRASHWRTARVRESVPWYGIGPRCDDAASDAVEGTSPQLGPDRVLVKLWQSCVQTDRGVSAGEARASP